MNSTINKSRKYTNEAKAKLKTKFKELGIDEYAYKAQKYFNKAQDKIEIYIKGKKRPNFAFYHFSI